MNQKSVEIFGYAISIDSIKPANNCSSLSLSAFLLYIDDVTRETSNEGYTFVPETPVLINVIPPDKRREAILSLTHNNPEVLLLATIQTVQHLAAEQKRIMDASETDERSKQQISESIKLILEMDNDAPTGLHNFLKHNIG